MSDRKLTTQVLKSAAVSYMLKQGYSSFIELGVETWGKRKADVISVNVGGKIVLIEVKSSVADYSTDKKWRDYIPKCNRMFFCFTEATYHKLSVRLKEDLAGTGVGVLVLDSKTGYLKAKHPWAVDKLMTRKNKMIMLARMAWRNGTSKRNSRRKRHYVNEGNVT